MARTKSNNGTPGRTRTIDLRRVVAMLYLLSYGYGGETLERSVGIEPTSSAWKAEAQPIYQPRTYYVILKLRVAYNNLDRLHQLPQPNLYTDAPRTMTSDFHSPRKYRQLS